MKKSQMYKKINQRNRMFNHVNRNVVYPTIYFNPNIHEGTTNTVEIVELNSDGVDENEQYNNCDNRHSWCNTTDESQECVDEDLVNRTTTDKRPQQNENSQSIKNINNINKYYDEDVLNQIFTDFYGIDCDDRGKRIPVIKNPKPEFFTIINNHITSETSSDTNTYEDIEIMHCENTINNNDYSRSNESFKDHNNIYENDFNTEKRNIWIYALKNKQFLSEHDFQSTSTPSKESTNTADEEAPTNEIPMIRKLATPIPTYIPRLNLPISPTLPTVKEITEPNKLSLNNSVISQSKTDDIDVPFKTYMNSWFEKEIITIDKRETNRKEEYQGKDLQFLSPRERRRLKLYKTDEYDNVNQIKEDSRQYCQPKVILNNTERNNTLNIASRANDIEGKENNEDCVGFTKTHSNAKDKESFFHINNRTLNNTLCNLQKPHIKLTNRTATNENNITDPTKKLDGNWVGENNELLEEYDFNVPMTEGNDAQEIAYKIEEASDECVSDRLFIRNMSLLKPAELTQYLTVTESMPSLHLSISLDTDCDNEKKSWFKRFLNFIHCCK